MKSSMRYWIGVVYIACLAASPSAWAQPSCPLNSLFLPCPAEVDLAMPTNSASCDYAGASYSAPAGHLEAFASADAFGGEYPAWVGVADEFVVLGGLPFGEAITFRVGLGVASYSNECGIGGCGIGSGSIEVDSTTASWSLSQTETGPVATIHSFIGSPVRISYGLGASAVSLLNPIWVSAWAQFSFLDLPEGSTVTSCQGYAQTTVTAVEGSESKGRLSLRTLGPNPSSGTFQVEAALPGGSPASVSLFDVRGRLVQSVSLDGRGAGRHTVHFGADKRLAAGVYYARLTQGRSSMRLKVVVLR